MTKFLAAEWALAANLATTGLFLVFGAGWLADLSAAAWFAFVSLWLLAVMFQSAFAVVRHAEALAVKLGEPYGTLILTLAVTGIEVIMIAAVMYTGKGNSALARDAMMAVVMIALNGMVGLCLVLGGLRYREQAYNLQGANAFLAVILPLAVLGLVQPNFTVTTPGPVYSPVQAAFLIVTSVVLYGVFLGMQTSRHRDYFVSPSAPAGGPEPHSPGHALRSISYHAAMLFAYIVPLVVLSKQIGVPINHAIRVLRAPPELAGFLVSALILSPESLSAVRAALANQLQRSVNVLLGSVLASIGLTIPAVLAVGFVTGQEIVLGLGATDTNLLLLTLALSMLTFAAPRTNVLAGAVHLLLFFAYLLFIFER
ncbi:MAG TPA: ionic transporter y4hA [Burkholderiales bacterium]|nr:ionic transporter y4hA [Burkholderiales bacterium]